MVNQSIRDSILSGIIAHFDSGVVKTPAPAQQLELGADVKAENVHDMILRAISKIDALDHDTSAKFSGLVVRVEDVEDKVAVTEAMLESHIDVSDKRHDVSDKRHDLSDHRHVLAETRFRVNMNAITQLRAESDVTDARFFDVMQYVSDLRDRVSELETGVSELETGVSVLRVISNIDALDHDTSAKLSGFAVRLEDVEDKVAVTEARLESHIDALDKRQVSANETAITDVTSMLTKLYAESDDRQDDFEERLRSIEAFVSARSPVQVRPEAYALASQVVQQYRTALTE